jgi:hypothetical protein
MVFLICVVCSPAIAWLVAEAPLASSSPPAHPGSLATASSSTVPQHPPDTVASAATTISSTAAEAATTTPSSSPETTTVQSTPSVPAEGAATQYGCVAAMAYLAAYAAPGFASSCPGNAAGHQAETMCATSPPDCETGTIAIADPCPAAYMNEAANSWILISVTTGPIDPYGSCG